MCRAIYGCTCKGACNAGLFGFLFWGFNFAFFIFGAAMLGIGIYVLVDMPDLGQDSESMENVIIAMISVGCTIFLIGFLGCCAVTKDKSCYLTMYTILVAVVLCVQITLIFLAEFLVTVPDDLSDRWDPALDAYQPPSDNQPQDSELIDQLQQFAQCCGVANATDWARNPNLGVNPVPLSCCIIDADEENEPIEHQQQVDACFAQITTPPGEDEEVRLFTQGCAEAWEEKLDYYSELVIVTLAIFAACQVVGIVFACCLSKKIGQNQVNTVA